MARRKNKRNRSYRTRTFPTRRPTPPRVRSVYIPISSGVSRRQAYTPSPLPAKPRSIVIVKGSTHAPSTRKNKIQTFSNQRKVLRILPHKALVCARRNQRKQIMHAMGHAGKGGQRRPTNNQYRKVKC